MADRNLLLMQGFTTAFFKKPWPVVHRWPRLLSRVSFDRLGYKRRSEGGRRLQPVSVSVHAHGMLRLRDDVRFLRQHLEALTSRHEAPRQPPWHVTDAPEDYILTQMKAIVGIELMIARLEGKWKMSQNRSDADIDGVIDGLMESDAERDRLVADIVAERRPTQDKSSTRRPRLGG